MPEKMTWSYIYEPNCRPGGLREVTFGVTGKTFDNMESYADTSAIAAVWLSDAGTVTLETTSPIRGRKSLKLETGGANDTLYRAIDTSIFGYPFPGNGYPKPRRTNVAGFRVA